MSDFDDLKQERLRQEAETKQQQDLHRMKQQQKYQLAAERNARKRAALEQYDSTVRRVLEELRQAVYPNMEVQGSWSLGFMHEDNWSDYGPTWKPHLEVSLKFSDDGNPIGFICRSKGNTLEANLSHQSLVDTLRKLHDITRQPQAQSGSSHSKTSDVKGATAITAILVALAVPSIGLGGCFVLLMFGTMISSDPFAGALLIVAVIIAVIWFLVYGVTKLIG